jgi:flagellar basal-body rod protein FlgF
MTGKGDFNMLKGFYNLASGMITQSRVLNTIGNNLANISTPGFKSDRLISSTFRNMLLMRTGNKNKSNPTPLGESSMIRSAVKTYTSYEQGVFKETGRVFDFAIADGGFFRIQTGEGEVLTRNGSFTLDDEGYLYLQHVGRVMGEDGPIILGTDEFTVDFSGGIYTQNGFAGRLALIDFYDYDLLTKTGEGMFQNNDAQNVYNAYEGTIMWKTLEGSNVDTIQEMSAMMSSQRSLQSCSQVIKMYDELLGKAVSEIGRV